MFNIMKEKSSPENKARRMSLLSELFLVRSHVKLRSDGWILDGLLTVNRQEMDKE